MAGNGRLQHHLGGDVAPEGIADWLKKDTFVRGVVENYQTKVLLIGGSENVNKPVRSDKEMLEHALETIDSVDFVGLTEHFNDSISVFNDISGMNFSTIPHANRARGRSAVSDQDIEAIRRLVPYDLELYERAREKLMARIGTGAASGRPTDTLSGGTARCASVNRG